MNSTKETKVMRTEKETAQTRRNFLRLGALGAAAVVAAGVLPGRGPMPRRPERPSPSVLRRLDWRGHRRQDDPQRPQDAQHG